MVNKNRKNKIKITAAAAILMAASLMGGGVFADTENIDPLTYLNECLQYHGDEEHPSAFSLRAYTKDGQSVVTSVKNQSPWGNCWGFSAIAAAEASILSECYQKWDQLAPGFKEKYGINSFAELRDRLDLSERQLVWFVGSPEPENGNYPLQAGEGIITKDQSIGGHIGFGGSPFYATLVFARGTGPIEESLAPYQNSEGVLEKTSEVTAKDGTKYDTQRYQKNKVESRDVEYECILPPGVTKEEFLERFSYWPSRRERIRKRLDQGVITKNKTVDVYEDDNGKRYSIVRINEYYGLAPEYPEILIFEDEDGKRYEFDPVTKSYPGMPSIHKVYYDWSVDESFRYASLLGLEYANILPAYRDENWIKNETINAIKDELLAGRGVSISFCADAALPEQTITSDFINKEGNAWAHYTYRFEQTANHTVTIVGYNDDFPKSLFTEGSQPPEKGAWLVKNSWGGGMSTGTDFSDWGIDENGDGIGDGYFWLSYWDDSISNIESFDFKVEDLITDRMEYDIRQYDLMPTARSLKVDHEKEANVFTSEANTILHEIGVLNAEGKTTLTYELYLLNDDAADPTDGTLLASGSEYFEYAGYHRMAIDKVCIIPEGAKYSVVVTQKTEDKPYVSVNYNINGQFIAEADPDTSNKTDKYFNAVVNRGESYILDQGRWIDMVDSMPALKKTVASIFDVKDEWFCIDNFSIKVYADFIEADLSAEAAGIGSGEKANTAGVSDEDAAKADALHMLALVFNDILKGTAAETPAAVEQGLISMDDYDRIKQSLIDPMRKTGLKVVVSATEISSSDIDNTGLKKLLEAANDNIARYADISLLVYATDNNELLGSLHRTNDPIGLAIRIPDELLSPDKDIFVLRLHNGVDERLETRVENGIAYFESDVFSTFALAYENVDEPEVPDTPDTPVTPGDDSVPDEDGDISEETGEDHGKMGLLLLMLFGAGTALFTIREKKKY